MPHFIALPARSEYTTAQHTGRDVTVADASYPGGLRIGRHAHRGPTITTILGGSLHEVYSARSRGCALNTMIVRPAGEPHADCIGAEGVRNLEIDMAAGLLGESGFGRCFDGVREIRDARASAMAAQLARELAVRDSLRPLAVEGLALELIAISARVCGGPSVRPPSWLSRAYELLHDRFRDAVTIGELAAAVDVHPVHFARVFRRQYGVAPSAMIRQLRVRWAADQIRMTAEPLTVIAIRAGFYDQAHFTRAFRQINGTTPSRFRSECSRQ